ncbi:hypothetical protein ACSH77_000681 [Salmonella enterica]|uniref:hypothetical protein n=1 Tax=Salmonella enterica TaxID=28901 RepID=UPI000421DE64|nr:hypothetical protein [Salmonella enterica]EFR2916061.1 hypothetical protein [Salmonella enterica]EJA6726841.1 hypothetical protein [Salmonella enterica]
MGAAAATDKLWLIGINDHFRLSGFISLSQRTVVQFNFLAMTTLNRNLSIAEFLAEKSVTPVINFFII